MTLEMPTTPEGWRKVYAPLMGELKAWWASRGRKLCRVDQFVDLERRFGAWIAENVCRIYNINDMSCLVAALAFAKEPV